MIRRIDILRSLELEAYRMAYYLLEAEKPACEAAKQALLALYACSELPELSPADRRAALKRLVMHAAVARFARRKLEANEEANNQRTARRQ
ncbi:hypothetical protein [Cohnella sp. JJ-181]|uniref:hypothetical protein n=1 Tax=Cohnella rhizoplanae TaxID=2974897 RepID=UPI0022FF56FF|nr:hypothetical protein [Cohnella sp. JJ-181]CAI6031823.1 hypothetical protein COHCIP112018_00733 [Cohnella sp. JJ-181]